MDNSAPSDDFSDTIFWFLDDTCPPSDNLSGASSELTGDYDDESLGSAKMEENRAFWDSQHHLLQASLCRTTSMESRVRQATKDALTESDFACTCRRSAPPGVCRSCLRHQVFCRLSSAGYDCSLRKSKWNSSSDIPSGEHTYIEVVEKKKAARVIVELHFRAEFEMARAGDDYDRLVSRLPEVFVGKADRLRSLVKILCGAAKRCMKHNNIHIAPWRKDKYMLAKWLSSSSSTIATCDVVKSEQDVSSGFSGGRPARPRASMLTFALLPRPNCQAVAVV